LDREEDKGYYTALLAKSLAECTSTAGLETHVTASTFRSFDNFIPRGDAPSGRENSNIRPETLLDLKEMPQVRRETPNVRPEMSQDPQEVVKVLQEVGQVRQETIIGIHDWTTSIQRVSSPSRWCYPTARQTTGPW
jgi:hypothetical protein